MTREIQAKVQNNIKRLRNNDPSLTTLDLSYSAATISEAMIREVAELIAVNKTVTSINFCLCDIGDIGVKHLTNALRENKTVTSLNLQNNKITAQGIKELEELFKVNQTLKHLNLSENKIKAEGALVLSRIITNNNSLTELDVSDNNLKDVGARHLAPALAVNQTLTSINLSANLLNNGAIEIARAIAGNKSLTTLILENNIINEAALDLAEMLRVNQNLTKVDLSHCSINASGINHIANALKVNTTLIALHLNGNFINNTAPEHLASALNINHTLRELDLSNSFMGEQGIETVSNALKNNYGLTSINLSEILVPKALLKQAENYVNRNKKILQMLPESKREHIAHSIMSQSLPINVPGVVTRIIREYDGDNTMNTRIMEKLGSGDNQTLDKILRESGLSSVESPQSSVSLAVPSAANSSNSSLEQKGMGSIAVRPLKKPKSSNNNDYYPDPIWQVIKESEEKAMLEAASEDLSQLEEAIKASLEIGKQENTVINLLKIHGAKAPESSHSGIEIETRRSSLSSSNNEQLYNESDSEEFDEKALKEAIKTNFCDKLKILNLEAKLGTAKDWHIIKHSKKDAFKLVLNVTDSKKRLEIKNELLAKGIASKISATHQTITINNVNDNNLDELSVKLESLNPIVIHANVAHINTSPSKVAEPESKLTTNERRITDRLESPKPSVSPRNPKVDILEAHKEKAR